MNDPAIHGGIITVQRRGYERTGLLAGRINRRVGITSNVCGGADVACPLSLRELPEGRGSRRLRSLTDHGGLTSRQQVAEH